MTGDHEHDELRPVAQVLDSPGSVLLPAPSPPAVPGGGPATWADRYGRGAVAALEAAHAAAEAARAAVVPLNTSRTYEAGWRVWARFCEQAGLPELHGDVGTLTTFVVWLFERGRADGTGYAPSAVGAHLTAALVGIRERGGHLEDRAAAEARKVARGHEAVLARRGEMRGRGKAAPASVDGLRRIAETVPDTLSGTRDLALVSLAFAFAARASEPAGLLVADVAEDPQGLVVDVRAAKTRHSVRQVAIPYARDPKVCAVRAWHRWRERLAAEHGEQFTGPAGPAFRRIDRWGHVGGPMSPDAVTAAVTRAAERAGLTVRWTGHSLRSGLASEARRAGKDSKAIEVQGGWAPGSRALQGYLHIADRWTDNAAAGLT